MKCILCLILAALTWGESVEAYWEMMKAGRYDEAIAKVETYLNEGRRVTDEERANGDELIQKAQVCNEMKNRAQMVVLVDSIKVTRNKLLNVCGMVMGGSKMSMRKDGGTEFMATRGGKRLLSIKTQNGYDIYRQYGEGEKERLSDVVNTSVNENFPYETADGVTLYFASEGHGSIGGYDLFVTRYNSETFEYSTPTNVGMPFNTLGNEYLMMKDDIVGLGLWATDWKQKGDTVMVYVYKLGETEENREEVGKNRPQHVTTDAIAENEEAGRINFFVKDRVVYVGLENFRSVEAKNKYVEMMELEREVRVVEMLLETKRMNVRTKMPDEEKKNLCNDILEDERFLLDARMRLKEMTKEIRQLELKEYE